MRRCGPRRPRATTRASCASSSCFRKRPPPSSSAAAPTSPLAEAFHVLALEVMRRIAPGGCLALAGVAARPDQGVTVTLTNLGIAAAQAGKRVVLVDADLRHPALHDLFELSGTPGLS